jgi:hypothetical protein
MPVAYDGLDNQVLDRVAGWLAASDAFQAFTGAADAAAARHFIVEIDGADDLAEAHAVCAAPRISLGPTAGHNALATAEIDVWFLHPPVEGDTEAEDHRRSAASLHVLRRALIEAAVASGRFNGCDSQPPVRLDESDGLPVWMQSGVTLRLGPFHFTGWPA